MRRSDKLKYGAATYSRNFESWEAFLDFVSVPHSEDRERDWGGASWAGASYSEALRLAREGWAKGREQFVEGMAEALRSSQDVPRRSHWSREVAGSRPCVGAACAGQPRAMYRQRRDTKARPIMSVCVNFVAGGGVSTEIIENRGIALASWIDAAEAAGTRVELKLVYLASPMEWTITLKRAQDPVDADRLAFALAHPAMLRRLGFGAIARDPKLAAHYGGSKGWLCNYTDLPAGVVYFPYLWDDRAKYGTRERAVAYVNEQCEKARSKMATEGALL